MSSKSDARDIADHIHLEAGLAVSLAEQNALNWGDDVAAAKFAKAGKAIGRFGPILTYATTFLDEFERTGNKSASDAKALVLASGSAVVVVGVGAASGPPLVLFGVGLVAGATVTKVADVLFDATAGRFGLFYDSKVDLRKAEQGQLVQATNMADVVLGSNHDDTVFGGKAADTLHGKDGNDTLFGGGDNRRDVLYGGDGEDFLDGGFGNNLLKGGKEDDELVFRTVNTKLRGGSGEDTLLSARKSVDLKKISAWSIENISLEGALNAGITAERAFGNDKANEILGNNLDNTLEGRGGKDRLEGKGGNDQLKGGKGYDYILGGSGEDELFGGIGNDELRGNANSDSIVGGDGNDTLLGGDGRDDIYGGDDSDLIFGGSKIDSLFGGEGRDTLIGNNGDDYLAGGPGKDTLYGDGGRDTFLIDSTKDEIFGGRDDDTFIFDSGSSAEIYGGEGYDIADLQTVYDLSSVDFSKIQGVEAYFVSELTTADIEPKKGEFILQDSASLDISVVGGSIATTRFFGGQEFEVSGKVTANLEINFSQLLDLANSVYFTSFSSDGWTQNFGNGDQSGGWAKYTGPLQSTLYFNRIDTLFVDWSVRTNGGARGIELTIYEEIEIRDLIDGFTSYAGQTTDLFIELGPFEEVQFTGTSLDNFNFVIA